MARPPGRLLAEPLPATHVVLQLEQLPVLLQAHWLDTLFRCNERVNVDRRHQADSRLRVTPILPGFLGVRIPIDVTICRAFRPERSRVTSIPDSVSGGHTEINQVARAICAARDNKR